MSKKKKMFEVEEVDSSIEELILTGLISDKSFASLVYHVVKKEYFKGQLTGLLSVWCMDYFKNHKDVPQKAILNVIKMQGKRLDEEDQELIPNLKVLAKECFNRYKNESFNTEYIAAKALEYLETNFLSYKIDRIKRSLDKNNSKEAIRVYREGGKELFQEFRKLDVFPNVEALREMMNPDKRKSIMNFPGYMGHYLRPLKRGKMIAMFGPTKRGKSHWLVEWVLQGALSGLNVAYFPLEMTKNESEELIVSRWLNQEFVEEEGVTHKMYNVPIFDCLHNQRGDCEKKFCKGTNESIFNDEDGCILEFEEAPDHKACDVCRMKGKKHKKDYVISSWFTVIKRPVINRKYLKEFKEQFDLHCTGSLKIKNYFLGRGTVQDIESDLDNEETFNGWVADLIVVDSLDNLKKSSMIKDARLQTSDIWNESASTAKSRNALFVSATQGNRGSFQKDRLEAEDVAEDWNKALVVDGLFAINERGSASKNKTQKDKYWGRQQIEMLLSRYKKFIPMHQCMVLNNFALGQTLLDSEEFWHQPL